MSERVLILMTFVFNRKTQTIKNNYHNFTIDCCNLIIAINATLLNNYVKLFIIDNLANSNFLNNNVYYANLYIKALIVIQIYDLFE